MTEDRPLPALGWRPFFRQQRGLGFLAATGYLIVGIAYAITLGIGIAEAGLDDPIVDPYLWIMEGLTMVSAPLIVILTAAIQSEAEPHRRIFGVIGVSFAVAFATLTCAVHFVALTAGRQTGFIALEWPSTLYAIELLAWDGFLGLSLLFAGAVFRGPGASARIRWMMWLTGGLCLVGLMGPLTGNMALQRPGILGYAIVLPVTCLLLAIHFRSGDRLHRPVRGATPKGDQR